jgi:hypothetical protein
MHRSRITVQTDSSSRGKPNPTHATALVSGWPATIQAVSGGEVLRGRQIEPHIRWVVTVHWGGAITTVKQKMRVLVTAGLFNGKTLHIESILPEERTGRPHAMQLHCTEVAT